MSGDSEKLAAIEAAAQELKKIRQRERALGHADSDAKMRAMGGGVQRAIEAGDLSWSQLKLILNQHIKDKNERALLGLDDS